MEGSNYSEIVSYVEAREIAMNKKKVIGAGILKTLYQPIIKLSFYRSLIGRMVETNSLEKGRLLKHQVRSMLS